MKKLMLTGFALGALSLQGAVITVQSGGITLNSTNTGTAGTSGTPWLIDETMTSPGTLQFAREPLGSDNSTGTGHSRGKWISKTVLNNTAEAWTSFELELQVTLGTASGQGDGLSFADGSALTGLFAADKFSGYTRIDDARDYLNFSNGTVNPGESVTFNFVITDNSGNDPFYLLQTPNLVDVATPEPSTVALMGLGLAAAGLLRKRLAR